MGYELMVGNNVVAVLGQDGIVKYDQENIQKVTEMIAGQTNNKSGGFIPQSVRVVYKFDANRRSNNNLIYNIWKKNTLMQNRIRQLNALTFGRGFSYNYEDSIKQVIDRCWRLNRFRQKLNALGTDSQLYGEAFIALYPQKTGDVLITVYESNQVDIDFNDSNVDDINFYYVSYKDADSKDQILKFQPVYKYLNEIEFTSNGGVLGKVKRAFSAKTSKGLGSEFAGAMIHVKFNNTSAEVHGTSDFRQVYAPLNEYMDFRSDRLAIHQLYGSPMFDISIDTDDPEVITKRIEELAEFTLGSNPVHNNKEIWKPMEFEGKADSAEYDEKAMRGLIASGMGFPENLLFNQGSENESGTFALNKLAEDRQDAFGDAFSDMNKFIVTIAGGDITKIDEGEIIFPEISTMSEKTKAETYVLKVGAGICSRQTASYNTGHNWTVEQERIEEEKQMFGVGTDSNTAGVLGGRFSSRANNQNPNRDSGIDDKNARLNANNKTTQTFGNRKENN